MSETTGYACPVCGGWFKKGEHCHILPINVSSSYGCEHDFIPYPLPYTSTSCQIKMMCRKCLEVRYINE